MPLGSRHTCSISVGPGRQVATTSHSAATAAGEADHVAPAASRASAASRRKSWTTSVWPACSSWPAIGAPILPTPMNPIFMAELQLVEAQRVVPQDLLLAPVGERQRKKTVHRVGIFRIAVWVIGRRDEVVVAESIDDVGDKLFVALDGAEPLPAE